MRKLFLLSMICMINAVAMEPESPIHFSHEGDLEKQLFDAIRYNEQLTVRKITTTYPLLANSFRSLPVFHGETVSPLHVAAAYGRNICLKILLKNGADPNGKTYEHKNSPVHYAQNEPAIKLLQERGASITQENEQGLTPLCTVLFVQGTQLKQLCERKRAALARLLTPYLAYIDEKNSKGETPLHLAVRYGSVFGARFLFNYGYGASAGAYNNMGQTPFDGVVESYKRNPEMAQLFEEYGMFFFPQVTHEMLFDKTNMTMFLNRWAGVFEFVRKKNHDKCLRKYHSSVMSHGIICNEHGYIMSDVSQKDLECLFSAEIVSEIESFLYKIRNATLDLIDKQDHKALKKKFKRYPLLMTYHDGIEHFVSYSIKKNAMECLKTILGQLPCKADLQKSSIARWWGDLSVVEDHGGTFLHLAVLCDSPLAIRMLKHHKVDCLYTDSAGKNPAMLAVELKKDECVKELREFMIHKYCAALEERDYGYARQLLEKLICYHCDPFLNFHEADGLLLLSMVCQPKSTSKISSIQLFHFAERFLKKGVSVIQPDIITKKPFLGLAIHRKDFQLATLFLDYGAIVTKDLLNNKNKRMPQELKLLLQQKFNEQLCCICADHPRCLSNIPCKNKHDEFMCKGCYHKLENNKTCPICRGGLNEFGT